MRTCDHCNAQFTSEYETKMYCTRSCRNKAKKQRQAQRRINQEVGVQLYCRGCGQLFDTRHAQIRYCSKDCRFFYLKQRRRERREQGYRTISKSLREKLFDKADGKCGICKRSIDPHLEYPHSLSLSVDHVVPLSRGGGSEMKNLQIAHLQCNRKKGNRIQID